MAKIRLLDVETDGQEIETGTCELCFSSTYGSFPTYIFETEDKTRIHLEAWDYQYGDYDEIYVYNIVDFGAWLSEQNIDVELLKNEDFNYSYLRDLVYKYYEDKNLNE